MSKSVYLSPSTQEKNIGIGSYGTEESRMNQIADVVKSNLESQGIKVFRNKPEWTLSQVVADSNSKKADIHFAIHSNAGTGKARGCEIYTFSKGSEGEKIAGSVYREIEKIAPTGGRGIKFNQGLYELRKTASPSALVEVAFHDNPDDAKWIIGNINNIGIAITKGILSYFGITYVDQQNTKTQEHINYGTVNADVLNVRSGPGTSHKIIGHLKNGQKVRLIKKIGNWWNITYGENNGFVSANYIK